MRIHVTQIEFASLIENAVTLILNTQNLPFLESLIRDYILTHGLSIYEVKHI